MPPGNKSNPDLITRAEFARRCGVSRVAVGKAFRVAKSRGEVDKEAKKIDPECSWAHDYKASCGVRTNRMATVEHVEKAKDIDDSFDSGDPVMARAAMEFRKLAGEVRRLELDNGKKERSLVSRVLVEAMIGCIDRALNMMIMDGRASLVPQMHQLIKAGATVEEAQKFYHRECGKYIAPVKPEMVRALKKYDKEN